MRARKDREAHDIDVLLQRRLSEHLRGLADAGINALQAGVAQGPRHHLRPAVMAIEARLGDEHPNSASVCHRSYSCAQPMWCRLRQPDSVLDRPKPTSHGAPPAALKCRSKPIIIMWQLGLACPRPSAEHY